MRRLAFILALASTAAGASAVVRPLPFVLEAATFPQIENASVWDFGGWGVLADGTLQVWRHSSDSLLLGVTTVEPGGKLRHASLRQYRGNRIFVDRGLEYSAFEGGYFDARGAAHYYHTDYRGNIVMVTDSTGAVTQRASYYPYGEPHRLPEGQPYLFAAKERHPRTGATLFGPRNLLTAALLWTAPDALAGQNKSVSPWAYCAANPVLFIDPTGKKIHIANTLSESSANELLQNLQELTDDYLYFETLFDGTKEVGFKTNSTGHKKVGTNLVRQIIGHQSTVLIDRGNSRRIVFSDPNLEHKSFALSPSQVPIKLAQKGVRSLVHISSTGKGFVFIKESNQLLIKATPAHIILGHELIHALHHITGSTIHEDKMTTDPITNRQVKIEELNTVGLFGNSTITENALRVENGLPQREAYYIKRLTLE